jgi:hypothetical protein
LHPRIVRIVKGDETAPVVRVRLAEGSRLMIEREGGWRRTTLEALSKHLEDEGRRYHENQKAHGKSGVDEGPLGAAWAIWAELDLHPETPWIHFRWLLDSCGAADVDKLRIKIQDHTVRVTIPRNTSVSPARFSENEILKVDLESRHVVETKWGQATIPRPRIVDYRVAGTVEDAVSLASAVRKRTRAMRTAGAKRVIGELSVPNSVPMIRVIKALDAFQSAGVLNLDPLEFIMGPPWAHEYDNHEVLPYPAGG